MATRTAGVLGGALVLLLGGMVLIRTLVPTQGSIDLTKFAERVEATGAATDSFNERSIVGALIYGLSNVTPGRVDDFSARTDVGEAYGLVTVHLSGGESAGVALDVADTERVADRGLTRPCVAGPRCEVRTLTDGAKLATKLRRHPAGATAVLSDAARHLRIVVDVSGRFLTIDQVGAIASAPWLGARAPLGVAEASRSLEVRHIATATAL
jgi:hypothetical protein